MPPVLARLNQFLGIPFVEQGAIFTSPESWASRLNVEIHPDWPALPEQPLDRLQVREICRTIEDPQYGYVCAMAWGGQGAGARIVNARNALLHLDLITDNLNQIRGNQFTRMMGFDLFRENPILGLGPSYFTKLLFFFSPESVNYIMDKWTARSINYLWGETVVPLNAKRDAIHPNVEGSTYARFCECIDELANLAAQRGQAMLGAQVEQRLFSIGGRHPGAWRVIVQNAD